MIKEKELFSELDKAVETLQTTKQQLAVYLFVYLTIVLQKQHGNSWQNQNVNLKKIIVLLLL